MPIAAPGFEETWAPTRLHRAAILEMPISTRREVRSVPAHK